MKKSTFQGINVMGNSSFKKNIKHKGKFYKEKAANKFPKELLPKEYFEILKNVDKVSI